MDADEFRSVVEQEQSRLFSFAFYMLRNAEEARDVAQESFVRLWQHRERVPAPAAARAWLSRTTHNLCIDVLRARGRGGPGGAVELDPTQDPPSSRPGPERSASSGELREILVRALEDLSPRDRSIIVMREIQGLPYGEIADTLGMPIGSLKATLHRARGRLRERLRAGGIQP